MLCWVGVPHIILYYAEFIANFWKAEHTVLGLRVPTQAGAGRGISLKTLSMSSAVY